VIPPARIGFGSKLIERVLAREIGGKAAIDYKIEGVVFTAVAPLPDVEENTTPAEG
jgi:two-component sensor histidine kinase